MSQMKRYNKFNEKKKFREESNGGGLPLDELSKMVRYGGNPEHKRNPGDFNLTPPAAPRAAKSLCDSAGIFTLKEASRLLIEGVKHGLVSAQVNSKGFPQNIWSVLVCDNGRIIPLESQLENPYKGTYHGYPLPETDPMYKKVLKKWEKLLHG